MTSQLAEQPLELDPGSGPLPEDEAAWHERVDRYARPDVGRSVVAIATSVVPFIGLWALMYFALSVSYLLVLALAVPAAGFLLRTYILMHDCAHGSLLPGRRANGYLGAVLGVIVFTPLAVWRYEHTVHHATAGDLDRRFVGDVPTLTLAEYNSWSWIGRVGYRLFRNPVVLFGLGPLYSMLIGPRWVHGKARRGIRRSVWGTNVALLLAVGGLCWLIGWQNFLLVQLPLIPLAGGTGIWLFYVQHQFDDTYWERSGDWNYQDAGLRGSSYLKLPKILQFFTGSIGLHHVHHLSPKIPHYNLQRAHDENAIFDRVPEVSLWDGLRAARLKLWDEDARRLVTWNERRRNRSRSLHSAH